MTRRFKSTPVAMMGPLELITPRWKGLAGADDLYRLCIKAAITHVLSRTLMWNRQQAWSSCRERPVAPTRCQDRPVPCPLLWLGEGHTTQDLYYLRWSEQKGVCWVTLNQKDVHALTAGTGAGGAALRSAAVQRILLCLRGRERRWPMREWRKLHP